MTATGGWCCRNGGCPDKAAGACSGDARSQLAVHTFQRTAMAGEPSAGPRRRRQDPSARAPGNIMR